MHSHDSMSPDRTVRAVARTHVAWKGAAITLVAIVGFYVLREHWGHALGVAPYLLLLACPLMHIYMHGGRGHVSLNRAVYGFGSVRNAG